METAIEGQVRVAANSYVTNSRFPIVTAAATLGVCSLTREWVAVEVE